MDITTRVCLKPSSRACPFSSTTGATATVSTAANPQPVTSTSRTGTVNGSHEFVIAGYSLSKGLGVGKYIASEKFVVGGYSWAIYFYPDGKSAENNASYVSVFIALASEGTDVRALFELTLLDQSGNENHKVHSHFGRTLESGPYALKHRGSMWGYKRFFKRVTLETSDYLKDDCLVIRGVVGVVKSNTEGPKVYNIPVTPSVVLPPSLRVGRDEFAHSFIPSPSTPTFHSRCPISISLKQTMSGWDGWVEQAVSRLDSKMLLRSLRPINHCSVAVSAGEESDSGRGGELQVFDELRPWDRASVEVEIAEPTFVKWLNDIPSCGELNTYPNINSDKVRSRCSENYRKLLLFSGNDYLGLSSHPTIRMAAAKAAKEYGMGPRGSALICGYTDYHRQLETSLAELKMKEDCLLCPTGFSANMAVMVAIGSVASLLSSRRKPTQDEKVAVFSDSLNHASIIDGIHLAKRQDCVELFVYRHCDMVHLEALISTCKIKKKVVVTDSLFSMDGDFAPMDDLARLRRKHGFLLVIDDAHGTFVCGEHGGGVAEQFTCEDDVDICVGTLSKAAGCHGGFIACSKKWKLLIQSRGRSFIFSTSMPVPVVAAAHAAVHVAKKEKWRRVAIQQRVKDFSDVTGIPITSHVISLVIGSEEKSLLASRHLLESGFHVTAIRPPTVPPNSCRLRVALSAAHTRDDIKRLGVALSHCIRSEDSTTTTNDLPRSLDLHAKL